MADARFEDAAERPIRLRAETEEDLKVISALLQDAVATVGDIAWTPRRRRFALLVNRFRWEDREAAERARRPYERARAMLVIDHALSVKANGIDPAARDLIVSLLSLRFEPGEDGAGTLHLMLAGDGEIAVAVEWLEVTLTDVTRPYAAPTRKKPDHGV